MTVRQQPQLVRLPDGRQLAFAWYGPPQGVPCIVLSGMPGSRLAPAWAFPDTLLAERGVRLLGIDRPGYGASDPNPQMTALGVGEDLGVLCAALGLERLTGRDLGRRPFRPGVCGPLAPAGGRAAAVQPHEPLGVARDPRRHEPPQPPLLHPGPPRAGAQPGGVLAVGKTALAGLRGDRERLLARLSKGLPPPDREVLAEVAADPGRWQRFLDDTAEAFRQSGAGVRGDLAVASRPWGFELGEVSVPTWLWHGTADEDVPVAAARRMAQAIPGCQATFTDEGHLMGLRHAGEAVEAIRAATGA